jgi:hypothetical protein
VLGERWTRSVSQFYGAGHGSPDPAYLLDRRWAYVGCNDAADADGDDRPGHAAACDLLGEAWPL